MFIAERRAAGGKTERKTAVDESQAQSVATAATYLEPGFEPEIKATAIWHMLRDHGLYKAWYVGLSYSLFTTNDVNLANRSH